MYCTKCGQQINEGDKFCASCGNPKQANTNIPQGQQWSQPYQEQPSYDRMTYENIQPVAPNSTVIINNVPTLPVSFKSRTAAALLCFFFGALGVHRFYAGKVGTGILWLFTVGLFGIGALVDFIVILCGSFRDSYGMPIKNW